MSSKSYSPVTPHEAVSVIRSGDKVFIHTGAAAPQVLVKALAERGDELRGVQIYQMHTEGHAPYAEEQYRDSFHVYSLFTGANMREAVQAGRADFVPVFLSDVPRLFRRGAIPLDVAILHVSPPDAHGYVTLGVSVDTSLAAAETAKVLIAEINPRMPRTQGDGNIHISRFDKVIEVNYPLPTMIIPEPNEIERRIGENIAGMVDNGATLQMGIGAIPNAALAAMSNHRELGIHTEMFSDGIIPLVERGIITNEHKA